MKLCDYGCGQEAKYQFKNEKWCCSLNVMKCPKVSKKNSENLKGRIPWNKDLTKETDERVKKGAEKITGENNHMFGKIPWNKGIKNFRDVTEEERSQTRIRMKNGHASYMNSCVTEEGKRIQIKKRSKRMKSGGATYAASFVTEEGRRKGAEKKKGRTKENNKGVKRMAEKQLENWKDPEYQQKQKEARDLRPNKCEVKILNVLNKFYPNEWKYTGDFSFLINGKNPDFTCINGKKLLIEHFGNYYHQGEDPEERKKIFAKFGYKTLVIWENELKDMEKVENKIRKFVEGK